MGLFDKKFCGVCGEKAGTIFTRDKLADGSYICAKCQARCSSDLPSSAYDRMTVADVNEHMTYAQENAQLLERFFRETRNVSTKGRFPKKLIAVDDEHGWWIHADTSRPDVFAFDQVTGTKLKLDTFHVSEDERKAHPPIPVIPPYEGMPAPRHDEKFSGLTLHVTLNHPWIPWIDLRIADTSCDTPEEIEDAYLTAYELDWALRNPPVRVSQAVAADTPVIAETAVTDAPAAEEAPAAAPADMTAAVEAMKKFKELLDMGVITQEEFDAKKKQLLGL